MKIRTVTYRATVTPSEYQGGSSMSRSMEATAELEEGVCPDIELGKLVDYVHTALGKPTRAQAKAARVLLDVDALWSKAYEQRQRAEQERQSATRNREAAEKAIANGNEDYARRCTESAEEGEKRVAKREARAAELTAQAEAREQEQAVKAARALLSRPKPEPGEDPNTDDDIPF